jgi:hypothetical protein
VGYLRLPDRAPLRSSLTALGRREARNR